jgi:hypothetical protein
MPQLPHFSVRVQTPPASGPLSLPQIKQHLRVSVPDDDDYITDLLAVAGDCVSRWTGRALLATTYLLAFDRYPLLPNSQYSPGNPNMMAPVLQNTWPLDPSAWALILPRWPLIAVNSIQYYDGNDTLQTLDPSAYVTDANSEPPRLSPVSGSYWPSVGYRPNAVLINFTAGYATAGAVPPAAKHAIRLLVGNWYENREAASSLSLKEIPLGVDSLLTTLTPGYVW